VTVSLSSVNHDVSLFSLREGRSFAQAAVAPCTHPPSDPLPSGLFRKSQGEAVAKMSVLELASMDKSPHHTEVEAHTKEERDAQVLARLGKKSVLEVCERSQARKP